MNYIKYFFLLIGILLLQALPAQDNKNYYKYNVMLFPSDMYMKKHAYYYHKDDHFIPRYDTAFIDDRQLRLVIKKFEGGMADEKFMMQDLEEVMKNTNWRDIKAQTQKDIKTQPFEAIWAAKRPDIKIDVDFYMEEWGPEKRWWFVMNATDMYTNTPIGKGINEPGKYCMSCSPLDMLTADNYLHIREFANEIIAYYNDIEQNGRTVILDFKANSGKVNFDTDFGEDRLGRAIEDMVSDFSFQQKHPNRDGTENEEHFGLKARIPLFDSKGRSIHAGDFLRQIQKKLKAPPYNLDTKVEPIGLGHAILSIEGNFVATPPGTLPFEVSSLSWVSPNPDIECTHDRCVTDKKGFVFSIHYEAPKKLETSDFIVYLNGKRYQNAKAETIGLDGQPLYFKVDGNTFTGAIELDDGDNIIYVESFNTKTKPLTIHYGTAGPTLYIITAGAQKDNGTLKYPASDADSLKQAFETQYGNGIYSQIDPTFSIPLKQVTQTMVLEKFDALAQKNIKPNDILLFFLSGHGELAEGKFYFHCFDFNADPKYFQNTTISEMQLASKLDQIHCKKIVMIDACREIIKNDTLPAQIKSLQKTLNANAFFMSCSNGEKSWEESKTLHMATFTYTLLKGLKGEADIDKNKEITLGELADYVVLTTPDENIRNGLTRQQPFVEFSEDKTQWKKEVIYKCKK